MLCDGAQVGFGARGDFVQETHPVSPDCMAFVWRVSLYRHVRPCPFLGTPPMAETDFQQLAPVPGAASWVLFPLEPMALTWAVRGCGHTLIKPVSSGVWFGLVFSTCTFPDGPCSHRAATWWQGPRRGEKRCPMAWKQPRGLNRLSLRFCAPSTQRCGWRRLEAC